MERPQTRKTLIQSIERALNILELVRDDGPLRTADLARMLALSPSATSNIVRTLYLRGYLAQDPGGGYRLGVDAYLLGVAADAWASLRQTARAPMANLSKHTGFLGFLGVEAQDRVIAVHISEGSGAVVVPRDQNWLDQLHCTAAGKVLLAYMPGDQRAMLREHHRLTALTEATVTDWDSLEAQLETIRSEGICVCRDESVYGVSSVAVPVRRPDRTSLAALSLAFSSYFLTPDLERDLRPQLEAVARDISVGLP